MKYGEPSLCDVDCCENGKPNLCDVEYEDEGKGVPWLATDPVYKEVWSACAEGCQASGSNHK